MAPMSEVHVSQGPSYGTQAVSVAEESGVHSSSNEATWQCCRCALDASAVVIVRAHDVAPPHSVLGSEVMRAHGPATAVRVQLGRH